MAKEEEFVYALFEIRELSCDEAGGWDGFIIIWDTDEFARNITAYNLIKKIQKEDSELYDKIKKDIIDLNKLDLNNKKDRDILNKKHFKDLIKLCEENSIYLFYYQNVSTLKSIYKEEEKAKEMVDYYNKNLSYKNKHHYEKRRLI